MIRLSLLKRGIIPLSLLAILGCDSTVALDTTLPSLRDVYVSGICPIDTTDADNQLALSVVLLSQSDDVNKSANLLPSSRIQKERKTVGELLMTSDFTFSLPSIAETEAGNLQGVAYMTNDDDPSMISKLAIDPIGVQFDYVAGEDQQDKAPYVIFVLDQSSSHIGETAIDLDLNKATDSSDQRISFFTQVIKNLPHSYFASIISYRGSFDDALKEDNPTNVPLSLNPKTTYAYEEDGVRKEKNGAEILTDRLKTFTVKKNLEVGTPMILALKSALKLAKDSRDNPPSSKGVRPVVVLYTDGIEEGDTSGSTETLSDMAALYAEAGIPVHVMHLNLPFAFSDDERRRDVELGQLACKTRGDYIFVQKDKSFSESNIFQQVISNRIDGRWLLKVQSDFQNVDVFPREQGYLFNTTLKVSLGAETKIFSVAKSLDGNLSKDQRVWIYKD